MNHQDQFQNITSGLENVNGGGKGKLVMDGMKAVYKGVRPMIKEAADVVKDLGIIGGGAYGLNKLREWAVGGPPAPTQPTQPATGG